MSDDKTAGDGPTKKDESGTPAVSKPSIQSDPPIDKKSLATLKKAEARQDAGVIAGETEVPVGTMPSPWEFIHMPRVRGS